jgi:hypothetical protein
VTRPLPLYTSRRNAHVMTKSAKRSASTAACDVCNVVYLLAGLFNGVYLSRLNWEFRCFKILLAHIQPVLLRILNLITAFAYI